MQTVHGFIKRHQLIKNNSTIVVGVSGGPDSLALLHFLWNHRTHFGINVIAAHVDHMLRGEQSHDDYLAVAAFCDALGILLEAEKIDVNSYKKKEKLSTQVAARNARYAFFEDVMKKHHADYLALAHHGDDQVETMIMNQVRGSVGFGQAGIPFKRPFSEGMIIRPFLSITKDEIEHYCKEEKILPRYDESNESDSYTRNRFRKYVLPFLKKENPNVHLRMQTQSELLMADQQWLIKEAEEKLSDLLISKSRETVILAVEKFIHVPFPLQRRMITLILNYLYGQNAQDLSYVHIQQVLDLLNNKHPSGELFLPKGIYISRSYSCCSFSVHMLKEDHFSYEKELHIPGQCETPIGTIQVSLEEKLPTIKDEKSFFVCNYEDLTLPIIVRTRVPGDRMTLKGSPGSKKLKAIFIDQKVDKELRDVWPVVVDGNNNILWLPKLKLSSFAQTSQNTAKYVVFTFCNLNQ
ncbi:tRNA lysidine(34) synthetase TilS [Lottiidibacillus patelloidae]|uniref:tRNA(Ile)-lysidine synthase n=1 Tax=Lottiidibacillus patelloidae TaxID=2670334 RepID=A0A263BQ13_9BACI|nr:tRNA lysidine(34) synthetase TilS [Lottiidibacillus patelloidae]OZM55829.1 tRNA lysidine(34) synthetase TilS [Lottiidibacillus patelloidae]